MVNKILVVDDDAMNLRMAEILLKKQGYEVWKAGSGQQCLEILEEKIPDLILLDILMPEMDGFEVIREIKNRQGWERIPVIFLTADRGAKTEEECFKAGAVDYISKPFIPAVMQQRVKRTLELEGYRQDLEEMVRKQLQKITKLQSEIIITMGDIIESRDGTTGEHVKRTSEYVNFFLGKLQEKGIYQQELTTSYVDYVKKATPLHDIGKIVISDLILQKPGSLTAEEYAMVKSHAQAGGDIIRHSMGKIINGEFIAIASDIATHHHEKWDGTGYPKGLKGEEIPLSARIVAIADVFDALVSKRQYKAGMSMEQAMMIMEKERGKGFEPILLDVFMDSKEELKKLMNTLQE